MAKAVGVQVSPSTPLFRLKPRFYKRFEHSTIYITKAHNEALVPSKPLFFNEFLKFDILIKSFMNCLDAGRAQFFSPKGRWKKGLENRVFFKRKSVPKIQSFGCRWAQFFNLSFPQCGHHRCEKLYLRVSILLVCTRQCLRESLICQVLPII